MSALSGYLQNRAVLFAVTAVLAFAFVLWGMLRESRATEALDRLNRQLEFSRGGPVAPSAAALDSLQGANEELADVHAALDGQLFRGGELESFAGDSTAAFFELAGFVEGMNQSLKREGISIAEGERYGFSQFAQQGPAPEILNAVMAQKRAATVILDALVAAQPDTHNFLKREYIDAQSKGGSVFQDAVPQSAASRTQFEDTIIPGPKMAGFESYTFELQFEGYSESLREFLKALMVADYPVLVKALQVLPLDRYEVVPDSTRAASNNPFDLLASASDQEAIVGPVPIIRNNLSAFNLQLEVVLQEVAAKES